MPFTKHERIESPIYACQLLISTQQEIADEISAGSTMGRLADWSVTLNDVNGCQEHVFRYMNSTTWKRLYMTNWLIRKPNGDLDVMTAEEFEATYYDVTNDYYVPEIQRKTFWEAMLAFINTNYPELYINDVQPTITPYANLVPVSVESNEKGQVSIDGVTAYVNAPNPQQDKGSDVAGMTITMSLREPLAITRYLITQVAESYNAPAAWTLTAYNTVTNESKQLHVVTTADEHTGFYTPDDTKFSADKYVFTFSEFEYPDNFVAAFRIALTNGGEYVAMPDPEPFTTITDITMARFAEKVKDVWYDAQNNVLTIDLNTMGINDPTGMRETTEQFLKVAEYVNDDTLVVYKLNNLNVTNVRFPNQFSITGLQMLTNELAMLTPKNRQRVAGFDFSGDATSPSAIAASVTSRGLSHWNEFVENVITLTAISQPGDIIR